jgi:cell wall-associated NlpC family hydrolase
MQYGICSLSAIPMRATASDASEMINQVLFGECFTILEKQAKWSLVKLQHDDYEGWIDNKQYASLESNAFENRKTEGLYLSANPFDLISTKDKGRFFPVFMGSYLPFFNEQQLQVGHEAFIFEGETRQGTQPKEQLAELAHQYLETPYLWGGRTPAGIDCSGFTQMVYRLCGYDLPRDSGQQAHLGETLSFIEESTPGDLAFFDNEEGKITHVGIMLSDNQIIHASGKVRIDQLDQSGIFNTSERKHTHRLRVIKKII